MMYTMVLDGFYPEDIRVRKEAESIAGAGIPIRVVCRWSAGKLRDEVIKGVHVQRIGKDYTHTRKGIGDIMLSVLKVDFVFRSCLRKLIETRKVSVFHVHDLPLLPTVVNLVRQSIPVILDSHENYPEMLDSLKLSSKGILLRLKDKIFFNYKRWKKLEGKTITKADHIVAVIEEMKSKIIREYGYPEERITVVSNYEKMDFSSQTASDDFQFDPSKFYILYVGEISPVRGLETAISSLPLLKTADINYELLVVGGGHSGYIQSLQNLANKIGCSGAVRFLGYKSFDKVNYYMKHAGANIVPHIKNEHTDNTVPHKMFQIMQQQAPLIVSSCIALKRIVESNDAGFVFEASDPQSLANQIMLMQSNPSLVDQKVQNAHQLVSHELNWEREAEKLINLIRSFNG